MANQLHGLAIAQLLGETSGVDHVGEEDRSEGAFYVGLARRVSIEPSKEPSNARLVNLDHIQRKQPVRGAVGCLDGLLVGTLDEAKSAAGLLFEPVGNEAYAEPLLHLEIAQVSVSDIGGRHTRNVVAIHVKRHRVQLYSATAHG